MTALLMVLNCCAAFAETGDTYLNFTPDDYKSTFLALAEQSGMQCAWSDEVLYTYGYPMYYALNESGNIFTVIHDRNGVIGLETDIFATPDDLNSEEFGFEMGQYMACNGLTAYLLQHPECTQSDKLSASASITGLVAKFAYMGIEGAQTVYEEDLGDDLTMQISWQQEEEQIMLFFAVTAK